MHRPARSELSHICDVAQVRPRDIGQAGRLGGVNPSDISALLIHLEVLRRKQNVSGSRVSDTDGTAQRDWFRPRARVIVCSCFRGWPQHDRHIYCTLPPQGREARERPLSQRQRRDAAMAAHGLLPDDKVVDKQAEVTAVAV